MAELVMQLQGCMRYHGGVGPFEKCPEVNQFQVLTNGKVRLQTVLSVQELANGCKVLVYYAYGDRERYHLVVSIGMPNGEVLIFSQGDQWPDEPPHPHGALTDKSFSIRKHAPCITVTDTCAVELRMNVTTDDMRLILVAVDHILTATGINNHTTNYDNLYVVGSKHRVASDFLQEQTNGMWGLVLRVLRLSHHQAEIHADSQVANSVHNSRAAAAGVVNNMRLNIITGPVKLQELLHNLIAQQPGQQEGLEKGLQAQDYAAYVAERLDEDEAAADLLFFAEAAVQQPPQQQQQQLAVGV